MRAAEFCLGPFGDHTLCATVNDLRVCARHARPRQADRMPATCGNALPLFTGVKWSQVRILPGALFLPAETSTCSQLRVIRVLFSHDPDDSHPAGVRLLTLASNTPLAAASRSICASTCISSGDDKKSSSTAASRAPPFVGLAPVLRMARRNICCLSGYSVWIAEVGATNLRRVYWQRLTARKLRSLGYIVPPAGRNVQRVKIILAGRRTTAVPLPDDPRRLTGTRPLTWWTSPHCRPE
jgi:hypothetical protein